ncbi:MAG: aldehyde dehydrogenase family protein [Paracoccaceae bacterium]
MGGKSPFLVFDDASLDAAVEGVVNAIWFQSRSVCCAGRGFWWPGRRRPPSAAS